MARTPITEKGVKEPRQRHKQKAINSKVHKRQIKHHETNVNMNVNPIGVIRHPPVSESAKERGYNHTVANVTRWGPMARTTRTGLVRIACSASEAHNKTTRTRSPLKAGVPETMGG